MSDNEKVKDEFMTRKQVQQIVSDLKKQNKQYTNAVVANQNKDIVNYASAAKQSEFLTDGVRSIKFNFLKKSVDFTTFGNEKSSLVRIVPSTQEIQNVNGIQFNDESTISGITVNMENLDPTKALSAVSVKTIADRVTKNENDIVILKGDIGDVKVKNDLQDKRLNNIESKDVQQDMQINELINRYEEHDERISLAESVNQHQDGEIQDLVTKTNNLNSRITSVDGKVNVNTTNISTNTTNISALTGKVNTNTNNISTLLNERQIINEPVPISGSVTSYATNTITFVYSDSRINEQCLKVGNNIEMFTVFVNDGNPGDLPIGIEYSKDVNGKITWAQWLDVSFINNIVKVIFKLGSPCTYLRLKSISTSCFDFTKIRFTKNIFTENMMCQMINLLYPVGCIYIHYDNLKPAFMNIVGTWERLSTGRFLYNSANGGGALYGSSTHYHTTGNHTLTIAEMPSHTHTLHIGYSSGSTNWIGKTSGNAKSCQWGSEPTGGNASHNHGNTTSASNLPPYIEVCFWKRTA